MAKSDLGTLLTSKLGVKPPEFYSLKDLIEPRYFLLPSVDDQPLPSLELSRYLEIEQPDWFDFQYWQIDCYPIITLTKTSTYSKSWVNAVIPLLNDLHFLTSHRLSEIQMGSDLLFWFHFTQALKNIILKEQYIPALKYRELAPPKKNSKSKRKSKPANQFEIYPGWELIGEEYENLVTEFVEYMPLICAAGFAEPLETPQFYDRASLLHHFSECLLTDIVTHTYTTKGFEKLIADSIIEDCLKRSNGGTYWTSNEALEQYKKWQTWRDRIVSTHTSQAFHLYFHLQEPPKPEDSWILEFQVAPKSDSA